MFKAVANAKALLKSNGVFREVAVYELDSRLYAKWGSGFVLLGQRHTTSHTKVRHEKVELPFKETYNDVGFMVNPETYKKA
jgi:hypothetical protein